jgi:oligopeptide transport system permease protein
LLRYALKRLLGVVPTLLLAATLAFVVVRLVPGGPFDRARAVPPAVERALAARYRLDDPIWRQYLRWLSALVFHGDLGPTLRYPNRSVNEILAVGLPISAAIGGLALAFGLAIGVPLGAVAAARRGRPSGYAASAAALAGASMPRFVLGPLLVYGLAMGLHLFPVARWTGVRSMILPVACTALPFAAHVARLTRAGLIETLGSDWALAARAKGIGERAVVVRHALRGALVPVVAWLAPAASALLIGSFAVEKIFAVPGAGRYFVEAVQNRDYNLAVGVTLAYGAWLVVLDALADVARAALDPRAPLAPAGPRQARDRGAR